MKGIKIDIENERAPVWECPELLFLPLACTEPCEVMNPAITSFTEGDPSITHSNPNVHVLWVGPERVLHDLAEKAFGMVSSELGLGGYTDWQNQRTGFLEVCRSVFPRNGTRLGILTITSARRPAHLRVIPAEGITIRQRSSTPVFVSTRQRRRRRAMVQIGGGIDGYFKLSVGSIRFATEARSSQSTHGLALMYVARSVHAPRFFAHDRPYDEVWLCKAGKDDHEEQLRLGRIPAIDPRNYEGALGRIRTTPIVNFMTVDEELNLTLLGLEINPISGDIFTVRRTRMHLAVAMLTCSPMEHIALCQALRKVV